jgi:hypothetical protein
MSCRNFCTGCNLIPMEHRGVQFQVVQTANPTGWKWTVQLDCNRTRTGETISKAAAIYKAKMTINSVRPRSRNDVPDE